MVRTVGRHPTQCAVPVVSTCAAVAWIAVTHRQLARKLYDQLFCKKGNMTCEETEQALWVPQGIISAAASAGFAISDTEWMLVSK